MSEYYQWDDEPGSRQRAARLWLRSEEGVLHSFKGADIPGFVRVVSKVYRKNGKWSHNKYALRLGEGVTPIPFKMGFESGLLEEGLGVPGWETCTVDGVAAHLKISGTELVTFFGGEGHSAIKRWRSHEV